MDAGAQVYLNNSTAKVGIGRTLPVAKLDIRGLGTTGSFALRIADSLGTDRVVILDNGTIGIGITVPTAMLHVNGSFNLNGTTSFSGWDTDVTNDLNTSTTFDGDVTGPWNNLQIKSGVVNTTELADTAVTAGTYGNATQVAQSTVDADGRLTAASNATISSAAGWIDDGTDVRLQTTGDKVGIGRTLPVAKLDIRGLGTTGSFALRIADSLGTDRVVILDNGTIGIGITVPAAMLHVNGSFNLNGTTRSVKERRTSLLWQLIFFSACVTLIPAT